MKTTMKPMLLGAALLLGLTATATSLSQTGAAAEAVETKQIRIEPQAGALQLDVTGLKSQYAIDEPIHFEVRGNKTFYLWVYARDPRGEAMLLVPSTAQTGNKYQGGRSHPFPNQGLKLRPDAAGPHELTLIASTRWLDIDLIRRAQTGAGGVLTAKAATFDAAFDEKGIRIQREGDAPVASADTVVRRIAFEVGGDRRGSPAKPAVAAADNVLAFVRMDRAEYRLGDRFRIVFGATEDGYVHVFLREPDGDLVRLLEREVQANRLYEEPGTITDPTGHQQMVAIYSRDGRLAGLPGAPGTKGVTLDRTLPGTSANYDFTVLER